MTAIAPTGSSTSSSATTAAAGASTVDYKTFLTLLVAELKNQDPTEPMDATQYVAQLASFSNVEQSIQVNNKLDRLIQTSYLQQAGSIVGRTLTSSDGELTGTIREVRIFDDGIVAVLESGAEVPVTSGVSISE